MRACGRSSLVAPRGGPIGFSWIPCDQGLLSFGKFREGRGGHLSVLPRILFRVIPRSGVSLPHSPPFEGLFGLF